MGAIMIKCPSTGNEIRTDMEVDLAQFGSMPVFFSRTYCRYCKVQHEWFARNAWICDSGLTIEAT
jgi:hypothetical protein